MKRLKSVFKKFIFDLKLTASIGFPCKSKFEDKFIKKTTANIAGDIGSLSIDIDGNDYWIGDEINVVSMKISCFTTYALSLQVVL